MIKALFLVFEPGVTWDKIAHVRRGIFFIVFIHVLPLVAVCTALETWGLARHGKWQTKFGLFKSFPQEDVITFGIIQFVLLLAVVFVSAVIVHNISKTLQDPKPFLSAFTVVAYGFSPMFTVRFLDYFASMHPAVTWLFGMGLVVWVLYQGVPRVMQPDPTHAFGVYLSSIIVIALTSGLARLLTAMYVLGYMDLQHSWLSHRIYRLLGH